MYEVRKTDKNRYTVREIGSQGIWILGTGIIIDSNESNIAVYKNKRDAYKEMIRRNCAESELFREYLNKNDENIQDEIQKQKEIIENAKNTIDILQLINECRNSTKEDI